MRWCVAWVIHAAFCPKRMLRKLQMKHQSVQQTQNQYVYIVGMPRKHHHRLFKIKMEMP